MKKTFKTIISAILAVIMILSVMITPMAAKDTKDANGGDVASMFDIQIDTNKSSYGVLGVATITVDVTNNSGNTIYNVGAEAIIDQLDPCGGSSDVYAEDSELEPGETLSFTYKATLDADAVNLNGWNSFWLKFKRFFQGTCKSEAPNFDDGRVCEIASKEISFGKYDVEQFVKVWYEFNQQYNINFDLNYEGAENTVLAQIVKEGDKVVKPADPVRDGYYFVGWFEEDSCQNEVDFNAGVFGNRTLYAGWLAIEKITLTANKTEFELSEGSETVYFYAESTKAVSQVYLYTADHELVATMYDDGNYSKNGDDLVGDSVYSCKLTIDKSKEMTYLYYAANELLVSNELEVKVCAPLTAEELEDIEYVDEEIQCDIFESKGYSEKNIEEREELAEDVLADLAEKGLIMDDSLVYNEESATYTFLYASNVIGSIVLKEWSSEQNGTKSVARNSEDTECLNYNAVMTNSLSKESNYIGDAIILWSFDQAWDDPTYREPFYSNLEADWDAKGLETTVDWSTTVDDYKKLSEYEVIVFSGHGTYQTYNLAGNMITTPSLVLSENATQENDYAYSTDLTELRIGRISVQGGTKYAILPEFFRDYYGNDGLDGAFVFAENCEFRGAGNVYSNDMSSSLISASAEAVIGFHNSVMADYSRELMKTYIDALIEGETASEAFTTAREEHGYDDDFFLREWYGPVATPHFSGEASATLIPVGIKNGDFEASSTATSWNYSGDTRVITKLGPLEAQSKSKMAIISTGIGSGESSYLNGTEGSILQQTFKVTNDNSKVSFTYNVVSEEPYEYVGSQYDDTFEAELLDSQGKVIEVVAKETVNTSVWHSVSGIDFDGGDQTAYHTSWKTVTYDLSDYVGETVTLRFKVYDKGDSIYDTAVLIDNVYTFA